MRDHTYRGGVGLRFVDVVSRASLVDAEVDEPRVEQMLTGGGTCSLGSGGDVTKTCFASELCDDGVACPHITLGNLLGMRRVVVVYDEKDTLVAVACVRDMTADGYCGHLVCNLCVSHDHRNAGIGRQLMDHLLQECRGEDNISRGVSSKKANDVYVTVRHAKGYGGRAVAAALDERAAALVSMYERWGFRRVPSSTHAHTILRHTLI